LPAPHATDPALPRRLFREDLYRTALSAHHLTALTS
jgi:hypothetical protein